MDDIFCIQNLDYFLKTKCVLFTLQGGLKNSSAKLFFICKLHAMTGVSLKSNGYSPEWLIKCLISRLEIIA